MKKFLMVALAVGLCFQLANAVKFGSILKDAGTGGAKATAKVSERQSEVESRSNEGASSPQVQETQYGKIDAKFWYGSQVVYSSDDSNVSVILTALKPTKATGGKEQGSWKVTIGPSSFMCDTDDKYEKVDFDVSGVSCRAYDDYAKKVDIKLLSADEVKIKITSKSGDIREVTLKQKLHVPIFKGLVCQQRKYIDEYEAYECHEDITAQYPLIKTADLKEYAERMIEDFVKTDHGFFCSGQGRTSSRNVYYVYKDMVLIGNYDHYETCGTAHPAFKSQIYIGEKEISTSDIIKDKVGLAAAIKKHIANNLDKYGYDSRDNERLQEIRTVKDKANIEIINDYFVIDQRSIDTFYLSNSTSSDKYTLTYQEVEPYLTDKIKAYFKNTSKQNLDQSSQQNIKQNFKFESLPKSRYEDERKGYIRDSNTFWLKEDFKNFNETSLGYCQKGVLEACMRLGENFMLGIGLDVDFESAQNLFSHVAKNTDYEYLKDRVAQNIGFIITAKKSNAGKGKELAIAKQMYIGTLTACLEKDYSACIIFMNLSEMLPSQVGSLTLDGKERSPVELSLVAVSIFADSSTAREQADISHFLEYKRDIFKEYIPSQTQAPQASLSQQTPASTMPQSNSQNLAQKHKFTDGFSIDANSGIVVDAIYGLAWQDAAEIFKGSYKDAVSYCENLNHGGYSDWRLPGASELLSITDYGRYKPAINKAFKHVGRDGSDKYGSYWSSTGASFDAGGVWVVQFGSGFDNWVKINSADNFARCVRNLK